MASVGCYGLFSTILISFPLNSSVIKNFVRTMVYKGHSVVCNYFVTYTYVRENCSVPWGHVPNPILLIVNGNPIHRIYTVWNRDTEIAILEYGSTFSRNHHPLPHPLCLNSHAKEIRHEDHSNTRHEDTLCDGGPIGFICTGGWGLRVHQDP